MKEFRRIQLTICIISFTVLANFQVVLKAHVKVSIKKIYKALRKNIKGATSPEVQLSLLFH